VTNGSRADVVIAFARTGPDAGSKTPIGAFLVDTGAEGYRVGKRETTMGLRASETVWVELDGVRVSHGRLVGDRGRGLGYALDALDLGRLGIAAQAAGIAQAALEHATRYAGERRQFGRPIASFGAVRSKLAVMATGVAASRALFMEGAAAWEKRGQLADGGPPVTARSAMAKLFASETAGRVTEEAVRIFGGYGFMREFPVEKLMRDAKGTEIYEGTSEILRFVIGRLLTDPG
jgi:alkylation response protein AidB-like acyl-CoA dehydrogenase